jgi:hypothetical protein
VLNLRGEHYQCEQAGPHQGWAHDNAAANAVWAAESSSERDVRRIAEALERIAEALERIALRVEP